MDERLPQFRIVVWLGILAVIAGITVPLLLGREDAAFVFAVILAVFLLAAFCFVLYVLLVDAKHQSKNQKTEEANQKTEHQARMKVIADETRQLERLEKMAAELWSDEFREWWTQRWWWGMILTGTLTRLQLWGNASPTLIQPFVWLSIDQIPHVADFRRET